MQLIACGLQALVKMFNGNRGFVKSIRESQGEL